jgi:hypothetical protein
LPTKEAKAAPINEHGSEVAPAVEPAEEAEPPEPVAEPEVATGPLHADWFEEAVPDEYEPAPVTTEEASPPSGETPISATA